MRTRPDVPAVYLVAVVCLWGATLGCRAEIIFDDEAIERSADRAVQRLESAVEKATRTLSDWIGDDDDDDDEPESLADARAPAPLRETARTVRSNGGTEPAPSRASASAVSPADSGGQLSGLSESLKAVLPATVVGLPRRLLKASASAGMWAVAKAEYEKGMQQVAVKVLDLGSMSRAARSGMTSWIDLKVEKSDERGYRKTSTYKGWPTYEKYDRGDDHAKLISLVADRFLVVIRGYAVTVAQVKSAFDAVDVAALSRLAAG